MAWAVVQVDLDHREEVCLERDVETHRLRDAEHLPGRPVRVQPARQQELVQEEPVERAAFVFQLVSFWPAHWH